jgi:hypothetical protein
MKYKKRPVVIEAVRWDGSNALDILTFAGFDKKNIGDIYENSSILIYTLEGNMTANVGDYIIKGVNGEFYPCKPDIFEKTYLPVNENGDSMCFGDAIEVLKQGGAVRRKGWNGKGMFVVKQVPSHIGNDVIPKMQSLPQSAKDIILKGKGFINYTCQCLIYNENTGRADSWNPSIADVFAEDWEILQ